MEVGILTNNKFNSRKQFKEKILELIYRRKSFYFAVILCIALVGITVVAITYYNISTSTNPNDSEMLYKDLNDLESLNSEQAESSTTTPDNLVSEEDNNKQVADITESNNDAGKATSGNEETAINEEQNNAKETSTEANTETSVVTEKTLALPAFGKSILEFATDKMVYSKTLEQWRTHSGIDIASDRGTAVKAAADGIVADVKNDPRFGVMVIIDHQNGLKTVYANLAEENIVNPNQLIKQGDVIGSIGDTASLESADPPHLHFEVLKDDKPVDPAQYLPTSLIDN